MAFVAITITADTTAVPGLVPVLLAAATEWAAAQTPPIDISAMTTQQKITRYARGLLMSVYVQRTIGTSRVTHEAAIATEETAAKSAATTGLT